MEKNLELITKTNINFQKISFCFIIDCSIFLSIETKLYNLLLILSIIKIFYIINIEFAILLSADDYYKILIKNYDDEYISYEDLIEILYEAIIIGRFKNNILKAIKTAVDFLKNKNRYTIYLGFFDCFDDSFTYPNYWLKNILNDKSNSFIIILEKSRLYKEKNKEIIHKMINLFNRNIDKISPSKIKIMGIDDNFDLENRLTEIYNFLNDIWQIISLDKINLMNDEKKSNKIERSYDLYY